MTSCPLQLNLNLDLPVSRPLIPIEAVMVMLDRDQDQVLAMIESGRLTWAWDIASQGAERREVRIWRDCLVAELNGARQPDAEAETRTFGVVLPLGPELRSTQLQRLFTASQGHIQHLVDQGCLHGLNEARTGPNGFVRITRDSVVNFLRNRRIV